LCRVQQHEACARRPLTKPPVSLSTFKQVLQTEFAGVPLIEGDLFGGVALGLAYSR
jgi:hypothetical chaperone protein